VIIQREVQLKPYNTFHIAALARYFGEIKSIEEAQTITQEKLFSENKKLVLGGGSNILLTKDFDGLVVLNSIHGIEKVQEDDDHVWIKAMGGEVWHLLVLYCIENKLQGIENLSLIPGKVGAAPMQNIGAYGVELKDVFEELEAIEISSGKLVTFSKTDCEFGYRESIFKRKAKNQFIIASVSLRLNKKPKLNISYGAVSQILEKMGVTEPSIKNVSDAVISIRRSKLPDPDEIGNAGSFFKNPEIDAEQFERIKNDFPNIPNYPASPVVIGGDANHKIKLSAGWLIEQCGWKGKVVGNTGAHKDQALVLVNYGNASGEKILELSKKIQDSVNEKFRIALSSEVNII